MMKAPHLSTVRGERHGDEITESDWGRKASNTALVRSCHDSATRDLDKLAPPGRLKLDSRA